MEHPGLSATPDWASCSSSSQYDVEHSRLCNILIVVSILVTDQLSFWFLLSHRLVMASKVEQTCQLKHICVINIFGIK